MARASVLVLLCCSCKVLAGAALGAVAGVLVGGPPGALAGTLAGGVGAASASAIGAVEQAFQHAPQAATSTWLLAAVGSGALLLWSLVRYSTSKRYRRAIHAACRQLWRAEGALHSHPGEH